MATGGKVKHAISKWLDEWRIACAGVLLASRKRRFVIAALLTFVIFGTLINLLSGSTAAVSLFWSTDMAGKLKIIWSGFLAIFGVGRNFWDWLLTFFVTVLQSLLIGLIAVAWQGKKRQRSAQVVADASNADNVQNAGLAVGLAVLGSGCPTCGTTLLAPVIATLFSTSSFALASIVSGLLTFAAVLVALLTFKRVGGDVYAQLVSAEYMRKKQVATQTAQKGEHEE